jgi:hypothetical protein
MSGRGRHPASGRENAITRRQAERPAERGVRQAGTNAAAAYLTALRAPKVPANSRAALEKRRAQIEQWIAEERLLHVRGIVLQRRLSNDEPDTFLQLSAHGAGRVEKAIREPDATKRATMVERSSTYHLNSLHAQIPLAIAVVEGFGVFWR